MKKYNDLTEKQEQAIKILEDHYNKTKWNFFSSVELINKTKISKDDLNNLYANKYIEVRRGANFKLIILCNRK